VPADVLGEKTLEEQEIETEIVVFCLWWRGIVVLGTFVWELGREVEDGIRLARLSLADYWVGRWAGMDYTLVVVLEWNGMKGVDSSRVLQGSDWIGILLCYRFVVRLRRVVIEYDFLGL
jgi:hypothetical protein